MGDTASSRLYEHRGGGQQETRTIPTFNFQTITAAEALALRADDILRFEGGPARLAIAVYNPSGTVTISFAGRTVELAATVTSVSATGGLVFADGTHLRIGGAGDDDLRGTSGDDALFGGDGADAITANGGDNLVQGNQGDDRIVTDGGADTVFGGQGADVIVVGLGTGLEGGNTVNGNVGNDTITGGTARDLLLGGQGNDLINGGSGGFDVLNGNLGDDFIIALGPITTMEGEAGADTLETHSADTFILGGAGADLFRVDIAPHDGGVRGVVNILDWTAEDHMSFAGVRADHTYAEATATRQTELSTANALLRANARAGEVGNGVVAIQSGGDVVIFVDNVGDDDADFAVLLVGRTLADIAAGDIT